MNHQTPAPLAIRENFGPTTIAVYAPSDTQNARWKATIAEVHFARNSETAGSDHPGGHVTREQAKANARLLASSFACFDKAGRDLEIDAAELAGRIDLAALIKAAGWAAAVLVATATAFDSLDLHNTAANLREESEKLRAVLKSVQIAAGRDSDD